MNSKTFLKADRVFRQSGFNDSFKIEAFSLSSNPMCPILWEVVNEMSGIIDRIKYSTLSSCDESIWEYIPEKIFLQNLNLNNPGGILI
jgi:hypothetical protein